MSNNLIENNNEIIIYTTEDGQVEIEVRLEDENVWLTQNSMAELFDTTKHNISLHIKNIFEEKELDMLNRMVSAYLDVAEINALNMHPMTMKDWIKELDGFLTMTHKDILNEVGAISHEKALEKAPSKKKEYEPKPYQQMTYPGERVQVDVKYVPKKCMSKELQEKGEKYYQYTAIDEYTRIRYLWFSNEHSTYESTKFIEKLVKVFLFKIKEIQTDNGFEFTNRLSWNIGTRKKKTMFENKLEELGIEHKLIKPHTPRHNGKVERSHRKDQERFYYEKVFYSLEDLKNRAKYWIKEYNNFPMRPLGWLSPKEKYLEYIQG